MMSYCWLSRESDMPLYYYHASSCCQLLLAFALFYCRLADVSSDEELMDIENELLTPEELASRAETDNLLWHRFLSVFLWPAILTIGR